MGLGRLLQGGAIGYFSVFVLHKVQLCGGLNFVALLSRVIVSEVNKAFSNKHCWLELFLPSQILKQK